MKTLQEIQASYGNASARILNELYVRYDEIAEEKFDPNTPLLDRLTDAQKAEAIRDHRLELASKAREEAKTRYAEAMREYRAKVEQRKAEAEARLYGHGEELSADVLARASLASDEELLGMARIGTKTSNPSLKQAALAVGAERGLGEVLVETFGDEERKLFAEIQAAPPAEVLDRQTDEAGIDAVIPAANVRQLMPPAKGTT